MKRKKHDRILTEVKYHHRADIVRRQNEWAQERQVLEARIVDVRKAHQEAIDRILLNMRSHDQEVRLEAWQRGWDEAMAKVANDRLRRGPWPTVQDVEEGAADVVRVRDITPKRWWRR